jgi:hypothetical protein
LVVRKDQHQVAGLAIEQVPGVWPVRIGLFHAQTVGARSVDQMGHLPAAGLVRGNAPGKNDVRAAARLEQGEQSHDRCEPRRRFHTFSKN